MIGKPTVTFFSEAVKTFTYCRLHYCCLQRQLCDPLPVVLTEMESDWDSAYHVMS